MLLLKPHISSLILINLASIFISSSGVLGRLIELPSTVTSFFRSILGALFLLVFVATFKTTRRISWRTDKIAFGISGLLLALHWSTYFYSLQISNVSIAIISLFTYPIITTLIEPIFFKVKLERFNLITSLMVLMGVIILVPEFTLENDLTLGLLVGLLSALFYALRNLFSKYLVGQYSGETTLIIQLVIAAVFLSPFLFTHNHQIDLNTWFLLVALGLITTALGHTLFLTALKDLTTSTASVLASLQPVYAILLAVVLIREPLELNVIMGGVFILTAVIWQGLKNRD